MQNLTRDSMEEVGNDKASAGVTNVRTKASNGSEFSLSPLGAGRLWGAKGKG